MLNHCAFSGRLTKDPELRKTGSGTSVVSFSLAVERDVKPNDNGDKPVDYIDCVAWRQTAEHISKYFQKGQQIIVIGRMQSRTWEDNEGGKHKAVECNVEAAYFAGSKSNPQAGPQPQSGAQSRQTAQAPSRSAPVQNRAPAPQNRQGRRYDEPYYPEPVYPDDWGY